MEKNLKKILEILSYEIDNLKVEIAKSCEKKPNRDTLNFASMKRLRSKLVEFEKLGFTFRRASIAYKKEIEDSK